MPHTFVTGTNGFVAVHVIAALISANHHVTGSVRSLDKGTDLLALHPEWKGKSDFVAVSDYTKEGVWDEAFEKGEFDYVVHVAAPLPDPKNTDFVTQYLDPGVKGNVELLKSASKYGGAKLKAISITGTINAITTGDPTDLESREITNADWNSITIEDAASAQNPFISYCAAKKFSELATWDYVKEHSPPYSVTVLLPPLIFGPPIQVVTNMKNINHSSSVFYSLWNGSYEKVPPTTFPAYIDVRDLADANLLTLTTPAGRNARFLIGGHPISYQQIVDTLKSIPSLKSRLAKDSGETPVFARIDAAEGDRALGMKYRTREETFGDAARRILELEKELGGS